MKKLIIFTILFIGLRVHYHRHKISVSSGQTVYADDWGDEDGDGGDTGDPGDPGNTGGGDTGGSGYTEGVPTGDDTDGGYDDPYGYYTTPTSDGDGNYFTPIDQGTLPPDDGSFHQPVNTGMCVYFSMAALGTYFGVSLDPYDLASDYASEYQHDPAEALSLGVSNSEVNSFLNSIFVTEDITDPLTLSDDLDDEYPATGTMLNDDGHSGHQVVIVGYDLESGIVEYYDPQDGYYGSTDYSDFSNIVKISMPQE